MQNRARCLAAVVVAAGVLFFHGIVRAQEPPAAESPATKAEVAEQDSPLREQTIYIPYENLRKTFEKEGRGVFLPYEKFRKLWDAARAAETPDEPTPRRTALIAEIQSDASVRGDIVEVRSELKLEVIGKGWHEIPLRLADAAITEAQIGDQPARLLADGQQGYRLLIENPAEKPFQSTLSLVYAKGITRVPGQNSVAFQAPQAPVNRWKVRIPEAGVKVDIQPMIAATEVVENQADAKLPEEQTDRPEDETSDQPDKIPPRETVILAFVGAAPEVRIAWTPKAEGATGLAALASVQAEQQVHVDEGVMRTRTQLAYTISRAELGQLTVAVPSDQKVVNVFDANVRQWSVGEDGDKQTITVQLFEPAKGTQNIIIELEKFYTSKSDAEAKEQEVAGAMQLIAPVVEAVGVGRQQGIVVVRVGEGLRAKTSRKAGLVQVDAEELPPELKKSKWDFSYRFVSVPYDLALDVEKIEPRITADTLVEATLEPTRLALAATVIYRVERAGVFRLELGIPDGFTVRSVQGRKVGDAQPVQIDTHHQVGDDKGRLVVSLTRKALGPVGLMVFMDRRLDLPQLQTPTGEAATIPVPIPLVPAETVERATGRLIVYAPDSLRVNPVDPQGLRTISLADATAGIESTRGGQRGVLSYAFGEEEPSLSIEAERRKPQVTVRQLLVARVEDGVTKYTLSLFYDVLYSGVKSLRIDIPEEVAPLLRNNTKNIREQVIDPAPDDLTEGCIAWSLTGTTELLGSGRIDLAWESKMDKLAPGSSVFVTIPQIRATGVDRSWGQIVLTKAETIDLSESETVSGLRPIDPQRDLINGMKIDGAVRAYEYHDDWQFQLTATRYDLEDIKQTSIAKALLRMVVMRSGKTSVQALYRIRSSDQRLELQMPEGSEFDVDPEIDGRSVTMEVGKNRSYFIPLLGTHEDQSFLLELRYTLSNTAFPIAWPEFPTQPAVQKVYLCVYLPEEINLLETQGPWTREFRWGINGAGQFEPQNAVVVGNDTVGTWPRGIVEGRSIPPDQRNDAVVGRLLGWVSESVGRPETFPTDGRLYVFSTLQPGSPVDDGLRLLRARESLVDTAAWIVIVLFGLLLLPMRFARRACAVGIVFIAIVFCAIYRPLAVWNLCDRTLALPALMVAAVWGVQFLGWRLPNSLRNCCRSKPAKTPPTETVPPEPIVAESAESSQPTDEAEGGRTDD